MHTTNYLNTFIAIAPDSPAANAERPPTRPDPTVAELTLDMVLDRPFEFTSDDVVFGVWASRKGVAQEDRPAAREQYFSKGQPCLRSSPLTQRYGWGVVSDASGRVALIPAGSPEYQECLERAEAGELTLKFAMKSRR